MTQKVRNDFKGETHKFWAVAGDIAPLGCFSALVTSNFTFFFIYHSSVCVWIFLEACKLWCYALAFGIFESRSGRDSNAT